jgi:hypothetical protein
MPRAQWGTGQALGDVQLRARVIGCLTNALIERTVNLKEFGTVRLNNAIEWLLLVIGGPGFKSRLGKRL